MTEVIKDAAYYAKIEKYIHNCQPLWRLKVGDVVEQKHLDSILEIVGKEPREVVLGSIYFKDGKPTMRTGDAVNWQVSGSLPVSNGGTGATIEKLERWGILNFHKSIVTHRQKVNAVLYATAGALATAGLLWLVISTLEKFS